MADKIKLFGLAAEKGRWVLVILGFTINLCLGSVYAYSVFKPHVESTCGVGGLMGNLPFMIFLAFFSILMFFGGKIMEKLGPRKLLIIGGIIVGLGWLLSYFTVGTKNIYLLTLTYGVIAGSGVGLTYGCPIASGARWFPDKKGLAVGLMLAGFGGSALITAKIADILIVSKGLNMTFLYFGIAFTIILVILSLPFRFPQAGWKPAGWTPSAAAASIVDLNTGQMVKTGSFWGLFLCYIFGCLAGLMAIGISKPVGSELILIAGGAASFLVGIFAIFNAIGRPLFGALTDKITPKWAAVINLALILVVSVMMISARQGTIEVAATTLETKEGKNIIKEGTLVTQDGKVELKKGMFVIKNGNIEKTNDYLLLKEGSLSQKEDKTTIAPGIIVPIEKDGFVNLKKGAVVLNKGSLTIVEGNYILYAIAFIGFWLCLGGWLAIAPAATATFFGMQSYARNYGVVFFAYGIGALLGGIISGFAKDIFGSYKFAFGPTAALAVIGIVLAFIFIKPPKK